MTDTIWPKAQSIYDLRGLGPAPASYFSAVSPSDLTPRKKRLKKDIQASLSSSNVATAAAVVAGWRMLWMRVWANVSITVVVHADSPQLLPAPGLLHGAPSPLRLPRGSSSRALCDITTSRPTSAIVNLVWRVWKTRGMWPFVCMLVCLCTDQGLSVRSRGVDDNLFDLPSPEPVQAGPSWNSRRSQFSERLLALLTAPTGIRCFTGALPPLTLPHTPSTSFFLSISFFFSLPYSFLLSFLSSCSFSFFLLQTHS